MEIVVNAERTLREIADEFHQKFPFLKIEFFKKPHQDNAPSPKRNKLNLDLKVGVAGKINPEKKISINGHQKVSTLEGQFQDLLEIGVQIFRKSGQIWVQTTATDDWTLTRQNEEGKSDTLVA